VVSSIDGDFVRLVGITRNLSLDRFCLDLVSTKCVDPDATSSCACVVCDKEFDVDLLRLQPGFVYEWLDNIEKKTKTKNTTMPSTGRAAWKTMRTVLKY
jgi:hypothetical protein